MTLDEVIVEVRRLIQDESTPYRYDDAFLLGLGNQTLKRMALMRPDLFTVIGPIPCVDDDTVQYLPAAGIRIVEIYNVQGGGGVTETSRETLDQTYPQWRSDAAAPAVNWMRNVRNPRSFFIYPKAPTGQVLVGEYAETPTDYLGTDPILHLPDAYFPTVVDGVVYLAESIDNEHVNSGRAELFQKAFLEGLVSTSSNRPLTDTEESGLEPEQVI